MARSVGKLRVSKREAGTMINKALAGKTGKQLKVKEDVLTDIMLKNKLDALRQNFENKKKSVDKRQKVDRDSVDSRQKVDRESTDSRRDSSRVSRDNRRKNSRVMRDDRRKYR